MKLFLIATAILLTATCTQAQNYGFDLFLRGGAGIPDAPNAYSRNWKTGPELETGFEFTLSQEFSIGAGFGYLRNAVKTDHLLDGSDGTGTIVSGGALEMYSGFAFINYRMFGMVGHTFPYLTLDGGVTRLHIGDQAVAYPAPLGRPDRNIAGLSETAFQAAWGMGIDIPLSANTAFSVSARYVYVFTRGDTRTYLPIGGGFKFVF